MSNSITQQEVRGWADELGAAHARIAPRFARAEPRDRAFRYLRGLLSPVERKNGWHLAEEAGETCPAGMQRLLKSAQWNADAVRDDLLGYIRERFADPDAVVIIDETGFLKKGTKSAGVQRQYSGTAGRRENCQIGVFLAYSTRQGHVLLDRELYLPESWLSDAARCQEAEIPEQTGFATKPQLARRMLERLSAAQLPTAWVTGDTVYGGSGPLRHWLEERRQAYVLAIASNDAVPLPSNGVTYRVQAGDILIERLTVWQRLSAGAGAKGPRWFDWAVIRLADPAIAGWGYWLLVRRQVEAPHHLAYYWVFAPATTAQDMMVAIAGRRWTVEESLQLAKGEVGLDQYEVRHWVGWYRHITLAMFALAILTVIRFQGGPEGEKRGARTAICCH
jgi:SRSO17 transposase